MSRSTPTQPLPPWYERHNLDIQEFSAAGIRTFAVVEGKADAFPVIFLHGLPGGAFIWAATIKTLGRTRLAIAPDLPGWGRSFARFTKSALPNSVEDMRSWLQGLLAAQSIQRFDLAAHGDCAWPALDLLTNDPARVRRLALIAANLSDHPDHRGVLQRLLGKAHWTPKRIPIWLEKHAALSSQAHDLYGTEFSNLLGQGKESRTAPLLAITEYAAHAAEYRTALAQYRGATLLIHGKNDPRVTDQQIAELAATIDRPQVHHIEGAGHYPMLDAPETVAVLLKDFLSD